MPVADDRQGLDGETWIIEGAHEDKYHAVHRWCPGQRPLLKIEKFLKAVSGISQYRPDPKVLKQRLEADQQVQAELNRQRSDAIRRSNAMARRLAVKRIIWGLTCPYCRKQSRLIRFMNKSPHAKSYFICPCGRSFRSEEYDSS
jgi:Zn ribbon nucleic-acid-binding protein